MTTAGVIGWIIAANLALLATLLLIAKIEQRRQRRQSWWRGN